MQGHRPRDMFGCLACTYNHSVLGGTVLAHVYFGSNSKQLESQFNQAAQDFDYREKALRWCKVRAGSRQILASYGLRNLVREGYRNLGCCAIVFWLPESPLEPGRHNVMEQTEVPLGNSTVAGTGQDCRGWEGDRVVFV